MKKSPKDAGGSFQKPDVDVLENIRFEDEYKDKEAESLTELYEVKVEQGKEGDKKDEYEILSIYSCNECVMHEGSSNKVQFSNVTLFQINVTLFHQQICCPRFIGTQAHRLASQSAQRPQKAPQI